MANREASSALKASATCGHKLAANCLTLTAVCLVVLGRVFSSQMV